ncbi:MAG: hypothetical protein AAFU77_12935 [Myxococcota bacterium]
MEVIYTGVLEIDAHLRSALYKLGVELKPLPDRISGAPPLERIYVSESHPSLAEVAALFDHLGGRLTKFKRFDQEDLLAAEWLRCRIGWRHRYRPLRDNERFGGGCGRCHVGDEQRKPFALEGEPDWKSYGLMILNQRWDIVFAKPQVFQEIFKPLGVEGCEVVDTTGDPLNSIVQLKPQELVKLDTSGLRLEECTTCGELKFNHVEGDYLPRVVSETSSDFVATEAVFGSGGQAEHVPMISSRLYRRLLDSGLAGSLDYLPHANEPATDLVR